MANLPMPRVGLVPTDTPNALAAGRSPKRSVVAVTQGILRLLSEDELRGVLAHEISHVGNRDVLVMSVAATIAGAISVMARRFWWNSLLAGVGMVLAPVAAAFLQLAISRGREYKADRTGAKTIGDPLSLASALEKLEAANRRRPLRFGSPASQGLFIVNPFSGGGLLPVFSSPPPVPGGGAPP